MTRLVGEPWHSYSCPMAGAGSLVVEAGVGLFPLVGGVKFWSLWLEAWQLWSYASTLVSGIKDQCVLKLLPVQWWVKLILKSLPLWALLFQSWGQPAGKMDQGLGIPGLVPLTCWIRLGPVATTVPLLGGVMCLGDWGLRDLIAAGSLLIGICPLPGASQYLCQLVRQG